MIPHPEKMDKGGEDAYFMTEDGKFLGSYAFTAIATLLLLTQV